MNLPYGNWGVVNSCTEALPYVCKTNMDNVDPYDAIGTEFKIPRWNTAEQIILWLKISKF